MSIFPPPYGIYLPTAPTGNLRRASVKRLYPAPRLTASAGISAGEICEVPVGFKWFVEGLLPEIWAFKWAKKVREPPFLRINGEAWSTDKDGFIMDLLAAEMLAVTGKNPAQQYAELTARFGTPCYARMDAPASSKQKEALKTLPEKHHNRNACRRGNFGSIDLRSGKRGTD